MSEWKYSEPKGKRYNVSIRKWNKVFADRGKWPFVYAAIWIDGDNATAHFYYTIWAKLFVTIIYPLMVVVAGYRDAGDEVYRAWFQKKKGAFSSDEIYGMGDQFKKLEKIIGVKS